MQSFVEKNGSRHINIWSGTKTFFAADFRNFFFEIQRNWINVIFFINIFKKNILNYSNVSLEKAYRVSPLTLMYFICSQIEKSERRFLAYELIQMKQFCNKNDLPSNERVLPSMIILLYFFPSHFKKRELKKSERKSINHIMVLNLSNLIQNFQDKIFTWTMKIYLNKKQNIIPLLIKLTHDIYYY